jgi:hypothetical protein
VQNKREPVYETFQEEDALITKCRLVSAMDVVQSAYSRRRTTVYLATSHVQQPHLTWEQLVQQLCHEPMGPSPQPEQNQTAVPPSVGVEI